MGKKCLGAPSGEACVFGPFAGPAAPKPGNWRCSWCDQSCSKKSSPSPTVKPAGNSSLPTSLTRSRREPFASYRKNRTRSFNRRKKPRPRRQRRQLKHPGEKKKKRLLLAIENSHPMMRNPSRTTAAGMLTSSDLASTSERLNRAGSR